MKGVIGGGKSGVQRCWRAASLSTRQSLLFTPSFLHSPQSPAWATPTLISRSVRPHPPKVLCYVFLLPGPLHLQVSMCGTTLRYSQHPTAHADKQLQALATTLCPGNADACRGTGPTGSTWRTANRNSLDAGFLPSGLCRGLSLKHGGEPEPGNAHPAQTQKRDFDFRINRSIVQSSAKYCHVPPCLWNSYIQQSHN